MAAHTIQVDPSQIPGGIVETTGPKIERFFGNAAFARRADSDLFFPIKRGIIEDFETMVHLW